MHISIAAETLFHVWGFPITNSLVVTLMVSLFLIAVTVPLRSRLQMVPRGAQNLIESAIEFLWNITQDVAQDKKLARIFFPLVATIFFFILFSNWAGLIPGVGSIGFNEVEHGHKAFLPFLRSASADLNVTIALAIVSVFSVQIIGIGTIGVVKYGKKFFVNPLKKPFYLVGTFIGLLELMSEVTRLISYSFRLFGNVFAGEVLLIVMFSLVPYFIPLPFLLLEVFVGMVQAFVFAVLTLVFLKMATVEAAH